MEDRPTFIFRKRYFNQISELTTEQKAVLLDKICEYQSTGTFTVSMDSTDMLLSIMIDDWKTDNEKYLEMCEKNREIALERERKKKLRKEKSHEQHERVQPCTNVTNNTDNDSDSDNKKEEKDKSFSKKKFPTPSELVEAYKNTPQLVEKIKDEGVVRQRAEYKQKKKSKAYKTISGFIQQLVENVTTVSNGEIRYDVGERLRYAQNKAIDGDNLGIRRDERMERGFTTWKKFNSLTQKQNE